MSEGRFGAMIGALVWHPATNRYLLLKRVESLGGKWECVTGRLKQGESYTKGLQREVAEEIGVAVQVDFIIGTTHFYRGEKRVENELVGIHFCCSLDDPTAVRLSEEHSELRWVTAAEAEVMIEEGRWLKTIIRRAQAMRQMMPTRMLAYYRAHGFEI
jgi:8-oxo-dGTP diphosphatase